MSTKIDHQTKPDCYQAALEDEETLTLLGRDKASPATVRFWCAERVRWGLNRWGDAQIVEALECAKKMEEQYADIRARLGKK